MSGRECTVDAIKTFGDYGLVVINTHGYPNGFMIGDEVPEILKKPSPILETFAESLRESQSEQLNTLLKINLLNLTINRRYYATAPVITFTFADADKEAYFISGKFLAQLDGLDSTIVFGNMCYSGYESSNGLSLNDIPIAKAFLTANVLTYYGYQTNSKTSYEVSSPLAEVFEEHLYQGFFEDSDSTGSAHLDANNEEYYDTLSSYYSYVRIHGKLWWRQFGNKTYCYGGCGDDIEDSRDGQTYKTVCIGDQVWMAENLNWAGAGVCYDGLTSNCDTYGRLYTINELNGLVSSTASPSGVQGLCPNGWHIPSKAEVDTLFAFCGGTTEAAIKLRATSTWTTPGGYTNELGFNLLAAGFFQSDGVTDLYESMGKGAYFWTTTKATSGNYWNAVNAYAPSIRIGDFSPEPDHTYKFNCRCVKD